MRPILELDPTFDYTATFLWATRHPLWSFTLIPQPGADSYGVVPNLLAIELVRLEFVRLDPVRADPFPTESRVRH